MEARRAPAWAARTRGQLYRLLSVGFPPPSAAGLVVMPRQLRAAREITALYPTPQLAPALDLPAVPLEEVQGEYLRLFQGPGHLLAPPYESVYRHPEGLVMGEWAGEMTRWLGEEGLALSPHFRDLPEHVAVELEFMACLCAAESRAWRGADEKRVRHYLARERDMLRGHLSCWVPAFCQQVQASARPGLSPLLAGLLSLYITLEEAWVGSLLRDLSGVGV